MGKVGLPRPCALRNFLASGTKHPGYCLVSRLVRPTVDSLAYQKSLLTTFYGRIHLPVVVLSTLHNKVIEPLLVLPHIASTDIATMII